MGADPKDAGGSQAALAVQPPRREPPPKPTRARPVPPEDDETTIRVLLGEGSGEYRIPAPPPPLPAASSPIASTPLEPSPPVAVEMPKSQEAGRLSGTQELYIKIGAAIFAAGVLVGVVGSAAVTGKPSEPVVEAAASASSVPRQAPAATAEVRPIERPSERDEPAKASEAKKESPPVIRADELGRAPASSSASTAAPSCQQLLGKKFVERDDPKGSQRETRLANRELVRGNVPEAQAAYCKAFALDRTNVDRHVNLGRLFLVRRDWDKAAEYGQSALELDPTSPRALGVVGDAWAALDRTDEARSAWLAAEKKTKASPRELELIAKRNMALAKRVERLQDFSLAERLYRRVLLLRPEHIGAMKGIATCLERVGDEAGAKSWAHQAEMLKLRKQRSGR